MRWLLLVVSALVLGAAGVLSWMVLRPGPPGDGVTRWIRIVPGASLAQVADSLVATQLVRHSRAFTWPARSTGWDAQIKAGCYEFADRSSSYRVLRRLRAGEQTMVPVRILSGSRPGYVSRRAAEHMFFAEDDFLAALRDSSLAAELGTDTRRLFSYMLPDTYHFYCTTGAPAVVRRIKEEMDRFYADRLHTLSAGNDLTLDEVISLASIIEWETPVDAEKARIAGVYFNRLQQRWSLQADPTIQYALIELEGGKRRLFFSDYKLQHPYNTYLFRGLPPGPITNPGRASLMAAADPEQHDFMFFVASPEGGHAFNATLRGHNRDANILYRYLRQRRAGQGD